MAETRVAHRHPGQRGEVPRTRVIVSVYDSARGREVRVAQAKQLRLGVHRPDEGPLVAARCDRERECVVVAGIEEERVEELPRLDPLARAETFADERNPRHRLVDGDDVVWL